MEIKELNKRRASSIAQYRNSSLVDFQKAENINHVNRQYDKKIRAINRKIENYTNLSVLQANENKQIAISNTERFESAENEKVSYYNSAKQKSSEWIEYISYIAYAIAILGEMIDVIIAYVYFKSVKHNENNTELNMCIQHGVNVKPKLSVGTMRKSAQPTMQNLLEKENGEKGE